ncbi:TetR/AcrR family transcriptional regulator [Arthrobacter sp. EH-1B-1]|uniref:TetR/AcrR family transcriptional regulator n=1 Tax=Arthrobacter vasquezii TaxID=2977629 RepID=A0ABT6CWQ2_9MICC|nr:TetR/AcrR family transcriptional regulator [Arthrobacter vasquezii]MDF9277932.1 TetR/AcrR family transcriptional regulator [Arthrobacter vasquezii]
MTMQTEDSQTTAPRPKRVRRTGPYKAGDARREAILEAAIEHFSQWGYFNSSMPKIAAEVGLTKAGLIHHFGSKEALLSAVLELRDQRAVSAFFAEDFRNDPLRYFRQVAAQAAFNESQPGLTQMFTILAAESSNEEHPAHEFFRQRYANIIEHTSALLDKMVAAGTLLPGTDVRQVASEMLAVVDGFTIQWALAKPPISLHDTIRNYLDRLAKSITTNGRGLDD